MKHKLLFVAFILFFFASKAQNVIAVQNGSSVNFFTNLDSAFNACQNGDTVYIPGGSYNHSVQIQKRIHIIGAGALIDSNVATGNTILTNILYFLGGSSWSSIEGLSLVSPLYFGTSTNTNAITNFSISRCYLQSGVTMYSPCSSFSIRQNIIAKNGNNNNFSFLTYASPAIAYSSIDNNIILGFIPGSNNFFSNNIFLQYFC